MSNAQKLCSECDLAVCIGSHGRLEPFGIATVA
jgi:hypothetical protein